MGEMTSAPSLNRNSRSRESDHEGCASVLARSNHNHSCRASRGVRVVVAVGDGTGYLCSCIEHVDTGANLLVQSAGGPALTQGITVYDGKSYPCWPLSPRTLRRCEVTALAMLYFPLTEIDNAVNVSQIESGWRTYAWNQSGEDSRGLMQINVSPLAHPDLESWNLWDPMLNMYFAAGIWRASGWRAWLNAARQLELV